MADISLLTWKEIRDFAAKGGTALVPLGSLEQHGPHLAVQTDTLVITRIAEAVEKRLEEQGVLICRTPTLWVGCSPHHLDLFTVSLNPDIYIKVLVAMGESLIAGGFKRILFLNGHGGNNASVQIAINDLALRHGAVIGCATYWELAGAAIRKIRISKAGGIAHACELETSLVKYLLPQAVKNKECAAVYPNLPGVATIDMTESGPVKLGMRFSDLSPEGNLGDPASASAAKGEKFFNVIVASVTEAIGEFSKLSFGNRPN